MVVPEWVHWPDPWDHSFRILLLPCHPQCVDVLPLDHKLAARAPAIGFTHTVFKGRKQEHM